MSKAGKPVRVYLRIRPPVAKELERRDELNAIEIDPLDPTTCILKPTKRKLVLDDSSAGGMKADEPKRFGFHHCFAQNSSQDDVYEQVARESVKEVFDGYHGLIFVYGQTGTGKTYTISNSTPGQEGILYNAVVEIFARIAHDEDHEYECGLQFVQIYNEEIEDLLHPSKPKVHLMEDPSGDGAILRDCTTHTVCNAKECLDLFLAGEDRKTFAATGMNDRSSRSHSVFMLDVAKRALTTSNVNEDRSVLRGRLILVDLAGSEKVKKTGSEGQQRKEANKINNSLLVLGRVINHIIDKNSGHIPFRDSKLTRLLQYPLSGNGKTAIIVTCGPSQYNADETHSAVLFGQRAMLLKENAKVHKKVDWKALAEQYQAIIANHTEIITKQVRDEVAAEIADYKQTIERAEAMHEEAMRNIGDLTACVKKQKIKNSEMKKQLKKHGLIPESGSSSKGEKGDKDGSRERDSTKNRAVTTTTTPTGDEPVTPTSTTATSDGAPTPSSHQDQVNVAKWREADFARRRAEGQLAASQSRLLELSTEIRRLDKENRAGGGEGRRRDIKLITADDLALSSSSPSRKLDNSTEDGSEDEDGTLEIHSPDASGASLSFHSANDDESAAYADTGEQLAVALGQLVRLRREKEALINEANIANNKNTKLSAQLAEARMILHEEKQQNAQIQEEMLALAKKQMEMEQQHTTSQENFSKTQQVAHEKSVAMLQKIQQRVDRIRSQKEAAENELNIEKNSRNKLAARVASLTPLKEENAKLMQQIAALEKKMAPKGEQEGQ